MSLISRKTLAQLADVLVTPATDPVHQAERIRFTERDVGLPVKAVVIGIMWYYLFASDWLEGLNSIGQVALLPVRGFFIGYALINFLVAFVYIFMDRLPLSLVRWVTVTNSSIDGLWIAALVFITGGMGSMMYWVCFGLIVRNAMSVPVAILQITLNLLVTASYFVAILLSQTIASLELSGPSLPDSGFAGAVHHKREAPRRPATNAPGDQPVIDSNSLAATGIVTPDVSSTNVPTVRPRVPRVHNPNSGEVLLNPLLSDPTSSLASESFVMRISLLLFMTACCYGVQALFDKERLAHELATELGSRQQQLWSSGRLAAEIAHQLKNPLAIINNAAFNLQRLVKGSQPQIIQQSDMIREEIERADQIITKLMGYAQLAEGRVEKLDLVEEIERAITDVFPASAGYQTVIARDFAPVLPPLLMQRAHLNEVLVNLLKNAREALQAKGNLKLSVRLGRNQSVVIAIGDNGPGIPSHQLNQIFEPYFSTREKGTGLGLAIVKHNTELYGGRVRAESELGKGATFILEFPSKALMPVTS